MSELNELFKIFQPFIAIGVLGFIVYYMLYRLGIWEKIIDLLKGDHNKSLGYASSLFGGIFNRLGNFAKKINFEGVKQIFRKG